MSLNKVGLILFVGGLIWLAAEYYEDQKRPSRLKVPAESELTVVTGAATAARVVEQKTKKGVLASRQVELDVQSADRAVTLRLSPASSESVLAGVGDQEVSASYDPREQNLIYSLTAAGRSLVTYQHTAKYKNQVAKSDSGGKWMGWIAVLLGVGALVLSRRT